jgi:hypothetical protein
MKNKFFQVAIEIKTSPGPILKPKEVAVWEINSQKTPPHLHNSEALAPLKYFTDAILALSFHKITDFKFVYETEKENIVAAYDKFDHFSELYSKSQARVKSLGSKNLILSKHAELFESAVTKSLDEAFHSQELDLNKLVKILNQISEFESQTSAPLIYNFSIHFSAHFTEKLIAFYSFLFHLRSLVAIDHNAHVDDSSHQSVTCDSISDYLPKSDYTVNDALLYWHFKNLCSQYNSHKENNKNSAFENEIANPMLQYFQQLNHNACHLIEQLPKSFLNSLSDHDLEEALHHVQMDWLLGSSTGLLFKIREELYGVLEGYDKIFWTHCSGLKHKKASKLSVAFALDVHHKSIKTAS